MPGKSGKEKLASALPALLGILLVGILGGIVLVVFGFGDDTQTQRFLELTARVLVPLFTAMLAVLFGYGLIKGLIVVANNQVLLGSKAETGRLQSLDW